VPTGEVLISDFGVNQGGGGGGEGKSSMGLRRALLLSWGGTYSTYWGGRSRTSLNLASSPLTQAGERRRVSLNFATVKKGRELSVVRRGQLLALRYHPEGKKKREGEEEFYSCCLGGKNRLGVRRRDLAL